MAHIDELFELMTLIQTLKLKMRMPVVLFGTEFWSEVVDFDVLARRGMIDPYDTDLFFRTDSVDEAYEFVTRELTAHALAMPGTTL